MAVYLVFSGDLKSTENVNSWLDVRDAASRPASPGSSSDFDEPISAQAQENRACTRRSSSSCEGDESSNYAQSGGTANTTVPRLSARRPSSRASTR